LLTGLDSRAANVTSTIALFPAQIAPVWPADAMPRHAIAAAFNLVRASVIGGGLGAGVLLKTLRTFSRLYYRGWYCLRRWYSHGVIFSPHGQHSVTIGAGHRRLAAVCNFRLRRLFRRRHRHLMLAVLTLSGFALRNAAATKNVLAA